MQSLGWSRPAWLLGCLWCLPAACRADVLGVDGLARAAREDFELSRMRGARRARRAGSSAGSVASAAQAPSPRGSHYWIRRGADLQMSSAVPHVAPSDFSVAPAWTWPNDLLEQVRFSPLIDSGMNLYVATTTRVRKFDTAGDVLWTFEQMGLALTCSPVLDGERLLVLMQDQMSVPTLFSLALSDGTAEWSTRYPDCTVGKDADGMLVDNGTVFFGVLQTQMMLMDGGADSIVAASASSGEKLWDYQADALFWNFSPSAPGDGTLIFSSSCGAVFRLSYAGELLWRAGWHHNHSMCTTAGGTLGPNGLFYAEYREEINSFPEVGSAGGLWRGSPTDTLAAYRVSDGALVWRRHMPYRTQNNPAVGRLGPGGPLAVVSALGDNPFMPMSDAESAALLESSGGGLRTMVVAMDAETGETLWTWEDERWNSSYGAGEADPHAPTEPPVCLPDAMGIPTIGGDGTVYASSGLNGDLHAIRDADGDGVIDPSEVSTLHTRNVFLNGPSLAPGMTAVAPCWGPMYVFKATA